MSVPKTSVKTVDLDELERQLRGAAAPRTTQPAQAEDPLAELARIVGRDRPLRAIPGGRAMPNPAPAQKPPSLRMPVGQAGYDGPRPANSPGVQGELHLPAMDDRYAGSGHAGGVAPDASAYDQGYDPHEAAVEPGMADGADYEGEPYADEPYADEPCDDAADASHADADAVEDAPALAVRRVSRPRRGSSRALALAIPVMLAGVGVAAAVGFRVFPEHRAGGPIPLVKADAAPVKVRPVKAPGDQTQAQTALDAAAPTTKPSQIAVERPEQPVDVVAAAKAGRPTPAPAPAQPPKSTGIVVINGPAAPGAPAAPAAPKPAAAAAPQAAPAAPAPTHVAVAAPPAPAAPAPAAAAPRPMPTSAVDVPLPTPPRPSTPSSIFGTPHKVATLVVKPDGTMAPAPEHQDPPAAPAQPAAKATDPSVDTVRTGTVAPAATKPEEPEHARAAKPHETARSTQAPAGRHAHQVGAPLSIIAAAHRGRTRVADAAPARSPQAAATEATPPAGGAFAIQLASSLSERDAKLTLARLRKQYPGLLSNGAIHRADLGKRGVYYRVKVDGLSRDAAEKACSHIKTHGGRCIMTRG